MQISHYCSSVPKSLTPELSLIGTACLCANKDVAGRRQLVRRAGQTRGSEKGNASLLMSPRLEGHTNAVTVVFCALAKVWPCDSRRSSHERVNDCGRGEKVILPFVCSLLLQIAPPNVDVVLKECIYLNNSCSQHELINANAREKHRTSAKTPEQTAAFRRVGCTI